MPPNNFNELINIQRMAANKLFEENQLDFKLKLLTLLRGLVSVNNEISFEAIIFESSYEGISESEVEIYLDQLISDGYVKLVREGFYKLLV